MIVALRHFLFFAVVVPATIIGWALGTLLLLTPRRWQLDYVVGRTWARILVWAAGGRVRVEGRENLAAVPSRLVVANHTSYLDPPTMIGWMPTRLRFVMKKELASLPFVGWYARAAGHFFLDRERPREGHDVLARAVERAKRESLDPIVFPEGTRSADGTLQPLKAGSFQLAVAGRLPVQPVAVLGTHAILPRGSWGPRRGGRIVVRIGPLLSVEGLEGSEGRKVLAERTREALLSLGVPA